MADAELDELNLSTAKKKKSKPVADGEPAAEEVAEQVEDLSLDDLGFGKKKKKKKVVAGDEGAASAGGAEGAAPEGDDFGELGLKLKKKKKKTKAADDGEGDEAEPGGEGEGEEADGGGASAGLPWAGSSRDYHYEELLGRVFGILRENNPELAGEKHKTILKPPQVLREGTKKTVFVNFSELCKAMHRAPEHVIAYLLAELGTSGSLDGQARLIVKGRFLPKVFEGILRRYINDYVICNMCKSADTLLHKENRLFILRCQACGASRSVAAIKSGFVARVGRRKVGP